MAWAGDRPGELRRGAAVFFAVAAVGMLAFVAVLVANAAGDAYRRNVDERLTALANDGSTSFDREVQRLETTARGLANDRDVAQALATSDRATLERTATPGISFWRRGRLLAGDEPSGPAVTRAFRVGSAGEVRAALPLDSNLEATLERSAAPHPPDRVVLATGAANLPRSGTADGAASGAAVRAAAVQLLRNRPDTRLVATTPLDAVDSAADRRRQRVLVAAIVTILTLLAAAAAVAVWRNRRRRAARSARVELDRRHVREALSLVGDALAASHDTEALLPVITQTAMEAAGATEARLLRGEEEVVRAGRRSSSRAPLVLALGTDDDGNPLRLLIYSPGGGPTDDARELAEWFVSQAAIALENARLHGIVKRQAVTDDLTGLANRRRFVEALEAELNRAERFGTELAVVIGDLDDFKSINDRFGHEVGNDVLRAVGDLLRESSRDVDVAARLGGEEFAMLLPQTDLEGGAAAAERLREGLARLSMPSPDGGRLRVTASFGVASYPPTDSVDHLLRLADSALYHAKAEGKDRVHSG
jgi:diguanylate cyclase (GGDEF)-like protein